MIWFTADLHLGHRNLCKGESQWEDKRACRDFQSVEEMDRAIRTSLECVGKGDTLYILGDITFHRDLPKPQWTELHLVNKARAMDYEIIFCRGNHDWTAEEDHELTAPIHDLWVGKLGKKDLERRVVLCHYPLISWPKMKKGAYMLHGHCHGNLRREFSIGRMLDVGWDVWRRPLSWTEIVKMLDKIDVARVDHHARPEEE